MAELRVDNLSYRVDGTTLLQDVTFDLAPGGLTVLLGPNGAGKTTLLRAALGLIRPTQGAATLNGTRTTELAPATRARAVSYLPQTRPLAWPNEVRDLVALGRYAFGGAPGRLGPADAVAVDRALHQCDLAALAHRRVDTLSGGELARVHCARAFAAETPLLIADEPVAALDPRHQFRVLDLFQAYVASGRGALIVLHDIGLAARYADRLIWMTDGRLTAIGTPGDTLTEDRIAQTYGVRATVAGPHVTFDGVL